MKAAITPTWIVKEALSAFLLAMGNHKTKLQGEVYRGALGLSVEVAPSDDIEIMRRRAARAGRILADETKRKRIRAFSTMPPPLGGVNSTTITDTANGVCLRLTHYFSMTLDRNLYRLDMLGSRRVVPPVVSQ